MKRLLTIVPLALALTFTLIAADQSRGQGCCGGNGYGWGLYNYYANPYYPSDRRIPYFAEHPPVYYSYPVPRTYGFSPYASPPRRTAPEARMDPIIIPNPHVPAKPTSKRTDRSAANRSQPQPLVVINPYVQSEVAGLARQP